MHFLAAHYLPLQKGIVRPFDFIYSAYVGLIGEEEIKMRVDDYNRRPRVVRSLGENVQREFRDDPPASVRRPRITPYSPAGHRRSKVRSLWQAVAQKSRWL